MKGMLYKPDMVKAIVDLRKTVSRRLAGLKEINQEPDKWQCLKIIKELGGRWRFRFENVITNQIRDIYPRYQVGEVVYIKEAWRIEKENPIRTPDTGAIYDYDPPTIMYKSDKLPHIQELMKWKSPLFLPEKYARNFIKITDVRAERLQEITQDDVELEGVVVKGWTEDGSWRTPCSCFEYVWDSINKDYQWESNPWVFRYGFIGVENG